MSKGSVQVMRRAAARHQHSQTPSPKVHYANVPSMLVKYKGKTLLLDLLAQMRQGWPALPMHATAVHVHKEANRPNQ